MCQLFELLLLAVFRSFSDAPLPAIVGETAASHASQPQPTLQQPDEVQLLHIVRLTTPNAIAGEKAALHAWQPDAAACVAALRAARPGSFPVIREHAPKIYLSFDAARSAAQGCSAPKRGHSCRLACLNVVLHSWRIAGQQVVAVWRCNFGAAMPAPEIAPPPAAPSLPAIRGCSHCLKRFCMHTRTSAGLAGGYTPPSPLLREAGGTASRQPTRVAYVNVQ